MKNKEKDLVKIRIKKQEMLPWNVIEFPCYVFVQHQYLGNRMKGICQNSHGIISQEYHSDTLGEYSQESFDR